MGETESPSPSNQSTVSLFRRLPTSRWYSAKATNRFSAELMGQSMAGKHSMGRTPNPKPLCRLHALKLWSPPTLLCKVKGVPDQRQLLLRVQGLGFKVYLIEELRSFSIPNL